MDWVRIISIAAVTWLFSLQQVVNEHFYQVSLCDGGIVIREEPFVLR